MDGVAFGFGLGVRVIFTRRHHMPADWEDINLLVKRICSK